MRKMQMSTLALTVLLLTTPGIVARTIGADSFGETAPDRKESRRSDLDRELSPTMDRADRNGIERETIARIDDRNETIRARPERETLLTERTFLG